MKVSKKVQEVKEMTVVKFDGINNLNHNNVVENDDIISNVENKV